MSVDPTRQQFGAFKALPRDHGPIQMLNLIRLKSAAVYPPSAQWDAFRHFTGAEAYAQYGKAAAAAFAKVGGCQVFAARPELVVTGPPAEAWDLMFVAQYPSGAAFLAMVTDEDYKRAVVHRTAAVADSRLVRMAPLTPGKQFGQAKL